MNQEELAKTLQENYVNPALPGSFSGFSSFYRSLRERRAIGSREKTKVFEWMKGNSTYTKHRPARRHFKTNRVIVPGIDDTWQLDLADMQKYQGENKPYKWILICIDIFSKYVWVMLQKSKSGPETTKAFEEILKNSNGRKPKHIQVDEGNEFMNTHFKNLCRRNNINLYTVNSDKKACVVERFTRTLKDKMWRTFTDRNAYRYYDLLDDLISSYNNTYHRSIKTKPALVKTETEAKVWDTLYGDLYESKKKKEYGFRFNVGDVVRYREWKDMRFDNGYTQNWSEEVFTVCERLPRIPPVYRLKEDNGDEMDAFFYEQELSEINREPDPLYLVEKVLQRKKARGVWEVYVQWLGYPVYYNSWVPEANLVTVAR